MLESRSYATTSGVNIMAEKSTLRHSFYFNQCHSFRIVKYENTEKTFNKEQVSK